MQEITDAHSLDSFASTFDTYGNVYSAVFKSSP